MDKVLVKVFLPVGVCSCSQTDFLARVYEAVKENRDCIEYYESSADSPTAKELGISFRGLQIGSRVLQGNPSAQQIREAIQEEAKQLE